MWLAVVALSATGGWFFGKSEFVSRAPATDTKSRIERTSPERTTRAFATGSPRGLWMERVKKAEADDFAELYAEWLTLFPEDGRYEDNYPPNALSALRWMFGMWLAKDPDGFYGAAPSYEHSHWAAQAMVELMPERAAEMIFGPDGRGLHRYFVGSAASALAEAHPALYLKINPDGMIDLPPGADNDDWVTAIKSLAKADPLAAGNASLRWKVENDSDSIFDALLGVAKVWGSTDPPISVWADTIQDPKMRNFAKHAWLSALAETDPEDALKQLYAVKPEDDNDLRHSSQTIILKQLARSNPVKALKLLKSVEHDFPSQNADPFGDTDETAANPFSSHNPRYAVLNTLAEDLPDDPSGLIAAVRGLIGETGAGDASWQLGVEAYVIRLKSPRWTVDECMAVAETWASDGSNPQVEETLHVLATRAAATDPELALAASERFPETARSFFLTEIIKRLPESDPARRIELLDQLPAERWDRSLGETLGRNGADYAEVVASQPVESSRDARRVFAGEWGEQDPEAVVEWLESLPDDGGALPAAGGLASAWIRYDKDAAAAWAGALASGPVRDAAAGSISYWLSMKDSEEAWRWAKAISDPEARAEAYDQVAIYWREDEPEAFRAAHDRARAAVGEPLYRRPPGNEDDPFR